MPQGLPLFFHAKHLLPQGFMPMNIKEGNALQAIKLAMHHYPHFAICMWENAQNETDEMALYTIGTKVTVKDFHCTPKVPLSITLQGEQCIHINELYYDDNGLLMGDYDPLPHWPDTPLHDSQYLLSSRLRQFYQSHPEISRYHQNKEFDNLSWLCLRWLEILPIAIEDKQRLLSQPHCRDSCDFLISLMTHKH